ncbi:hypothetical protein [Nocardia salmonicida]|uniref:hypothetical protein n=1 Tax=Nocardia salmonicida TaxID=53431 RepID=UPI002E2D33EE|nr:hypothetical protein [Nocardia salmonicida]
MTSIQDDSTRLLSEDPGDPLGVIAIGREIREDLVPQAGVLGASVGEPLHKQRFLLAHRLLLLVGAISVILLAGVIFAPADRIEAVKTVASIIYGPLVALLGTSFAFYYAGGRD